MRKWSTPQALALAGSLVAIVLLMLLPRTHEAVPAEAQAPVGDATVEDQVDEAVKLVQGAQPMQGILKLRQLAEDHPENAEVQWQLGMFSLQSGQVDKAVGRFARVLEIDSTGHPEAWQMLGRSYALMDSIPQAREALRKYRGKLTDPEALSAVDRQLEELENAKEGEQNALR
ncbi:MAG: hypothetical protein H6594_08930 [Flavobacteriales bacterium]|nr:hypothetical protein [Flavobacteriales bacterium]MCB9170457.1 hypothetical protein [Flavobacteriales bacterium]